MSAIQSLESGAPRWWASIVGMVRRAEEARSIYYPGMFEVIKLRSCGEESNTSYIRLVSCDGRVHVIFLMKKLKLPYWKKNTITIPRLELTAATLTVRLHKIIATGLEYEVHGVYGSTSVHTECVYTLPYACGESAFIDSRSISYETMDICEIGRYPVDDISRGMQLNDMLTSDRWINGPESLLNRENDWPVRPETESISDNDIQIKTKGQMGWDM